MRCAKPAGQALDRLAGAQLGILLLYVDVSEESFRLGRRHRDQGGGVRSADFMPRGAGTARLARRPRRERVREEGAARRERLPRHADRPRDSSRGCTSGMITAIRRACPTARSRRRRAVASPALRARVEGERVHRIHRTEKKGVAAACGLLGEREVVAPLVDGGAAPPPSSGRRHADAATSYAPTRSLRVALVVQPFGEERDAANGGWPARCASSRTPSTTGARAAGCARRTTPTLGKAPRRRRGMTRERIEVAPSRTARAARAGRLGGGEDTDGAR